MLLPDDAKALPEPMMTNCQSGHRNAQDIYHWYEFEYY